MITLGLIALIGVSHFVGDFVLQSNWMALNKGKKFIPLFCHVLLYSACFIWLGVDFFLITFITHFITDAATSQVTSKLWFVKELKTEWTEGCACGDRVFTSIDMAYDMRKRHWFFVAIGADQLIHLTTLLWTLGFLYG